MKEVTTERDGRIRKISTPWLTTDEAALYCGISRNTFDLHSAGVPCGGSPTHKRWHVAVLDKWVNNELSIPFSPSLAKPKEPELRGQRSEAGRRRKIRRQMTEGRGQPLVDPLTGKTFG